MKFPGLLLTLAILFPITLADPLVKDPSTGVSYQGTSAYGVEQFQNIPFAKPPTGKRRFAAPEPYVPPVNSTINATVPGAACPQPKVPVPQIELFSNITNMSEDCLTLRIARPANTSANDNLPVMVWIYGGGDEIGQAYDDIYTPTGLVLQSAANGLPIIYVAVNYRVNIFGFAASDALRKEKSLNAGLRDQRLGIQWVKDNIATFGGDPNRITIFGESDGATGVGLQLTAFGGKHGAPFNQAIMQSGASASDAGVASNFSAVHYAAVANLTNCTRGEAGSEETLACLRDLPLDTLLNVTLTYAGEVSPPYGFSAFIPSVDGDFIPEAPSRLVETGQFYKNVSVIVGWTSNDGSIFTTSTIANDSDVIAFILSDFPALSNKTISKILDLYPVADFESEVQPNDIVTAQYYRAARIWRDIEFTCPGIDLSYNVMKFSNNANAYLYELNQSALIPLFDADGATFFGVSHFADIPYVFNEVSYFNASDADTLLASQMSGSWGAFAATGKPTASMSNVTTIKEWPVAYSHSNNGKGPSTAVINVIGGPTPGPYTIKLNGNSGGPVGMEKVLQRCAFINSIYGELQT